MPEEGSQQKNAAPLESVLSFCVTDTVISWIRPFLDITILMVYVTTLELLKETHSRFAKYAILFGSYGTVWAYQGSES